VYQVEAVFFDVGECKQDMMVCGVAQDEGLLVVAEACFGCEAKVQGGFEQIDAFVVCLSGQCGVVAVVDVCGGGCEAAFCMALCLGIFCAVSE